MPRLAANLSMMFNEVPFLDRFAAARKAGLRRRWSSCSPTSIPAAEIAQAAGWRGADPGAVQHAARRLGEGRARPGQPARPQAEFRDGVKQALDYAGALGCKLVHCMAGHRAGRRVRR